MSTFSGFVNEITHISIDRFLERNRSESTVFFLSHCHMDHMLGLHLPEPLPGPLYASRISAVFLKHRFPHLIDNIRTLDLGESTIQLEAGTTPNINVTTIPAGHCPGSVMFLFEIENDQKILYTGDFRISPKDLRNILPLRDVSPDVIYLDTTFFNSHYRFFPSQSDSLDILVDLCKEWLERNKQNVVSVKLPALYGSEFLFMGLSLHLKQKIHVQQSVLRNYRYLGNLDEVVTSKENDTRIHACLGTSFKEYWKLPCRPELDCKYVRVIRPSALRWRGLSAAGPFWMRLREDREQFSVCYSNHASYEELEDFVRYLKPKQVRFNVIPKDDPEGLTMGRLVEQICSVVGPRVDEETVEVNQPMKFHGIAYRKIAKNKTKVFSDEDVSDEDAVIEQLPKRIKN